MLKKNQLVKLSPSKLSCYTVYTCGKHTNLVQGQVLVIIYYKDDIFVITQDWGGVEVECNNNYIIQVMGYLASILYKINIG